MKSMTEMREAATGTAKDLAGTAKKAGYAAMGAPMVATRRIASLAGKVGDGAAKEFEAWVEEGEKLTGQLRDRKVVDELKDKVDFDHLQGRVEKLRDQLEDVLANWRETFIPHNEEEKKEEVKKPAAKATAAKKPATKAAATKTTATKPAATKTTASKS
ncbi:hypothetical protein HQ535_08895 [bacterium]|nr:hypothetical protein [bacterium]